MSQAQADAIHDRYRKSFVGRSRATRDLALLDGIIADAEKLLADGLSADVKSTLSERLSLYKTERGEIAAIQAGGPATLAGWRAVEWSELAFGRYRRHFAGQNRATRDLGLLVELAAEERANAAAVPAGDERLAARKDQMLANLKLFEGEIKAIPETRNLQAPSEQARILATCANQQFEHWRRHFEGKPRATRRPALLQRMIGALEDIRARMIAVRDMGVSGDPHASNIAKVTDRIAHFKGELGKIEAARAQTSGIEMARRLGDEANKVFSTYRAEYSGKPRTQADPVRLSALCDELQEIARAMKLLDDERPVEQNAKNLTIVLDHAKMMEREHQAIVEARQRK